jgi:hypothetical protein
MLQGRPPNGRALIQVASRLVSLYCRKRVYFYFFDRLTVRFDSVSPSTLRNILLHLSIFPWFPCCWLQSVASVMTRAHHVCTLGVFSLQFPLLLLTTKCSSAK